MKLDKWYSIEGVDYETKLAVIKDWIEKDCLTGYYLTLSEDHKRFMQREVIMPVVSKYKQTSRN